VYINNIIINHIVIHLMDFIIILKAKTTIKYVISNKLGTIIN